MEIEFKKIQCDACKRPVYSLWIRTRLFFWTVVFHFKGRERKVNKTKPTEMYI